MESLTKVQQEIYKAMEAMGEKAIFSESILAKKIREITKLENKKKAGIGLKDLENVIQRFSDNGIFYSLHLNSANDLLIKKDVAMELLTPDAKKRRQGKEKSMTIFTSSDFDEKKNPKPVHKKISQRKRDRMEEDE